MIFGYLCSQRKRQLSWMHRIRIFSKWMSQKVPVCTVSSDSIYNPCGCSCQWYYPGKQLEVRARVVLLEDHLFNTFCLGYWSTGYQFPGNYFKSNGNSCFQSRRNLCIASKYIWITTDSTTLAVPGTGYVWCNIVTKEEEPGMYRYRY